MNISELYEMQKKLDARIEENKNLVGQDLTDYMILALQTEIGEAANEWRYFKVWSNDREPREGLLVELVDCLHFILSIGYRRGFEDVSLNTHESEVKSDDTAFYLFNRLFSKVGDYFIVRTIWNYKEITSTYIRLITSLGFTWEQICEAYLAKNRINHERQATGY